MSTPSSSPETGYIYPGSENGYPKHHAGTGTGQFPFRCQIMTFVKNQKKPTLAPPVPTTDSSGFSELFDAAEKYRACNDSLSRCGFHRCLMCANPLTDAHDFIHLWWLVTLLKLHSAVCMRSPRYRQSAQPLSPLQRLLSRAPTR